ncbi:MAG: carboxypeptidase M32 [Spirochaetales bacterium]|nr:carboxypeptidase M32 [Spirochaetales bacterium]
MNSTKKILEHYKNILMIQFIEQILDWDSEVNLPSGGYAYRAEQAAWLAGVVHEKLTNRDFTDSIMSFIPTDNNLLNNEIAHIKRIVELEQKIPQKLREEQARLSAKAGGIWEDAKKSGDDSQFIRVLEQIIQLEREYCDCKGFNETPYDALLDDYDENLCYSFVENLFDTLVPQLQELIHNAKEDSGELYFFADKTTQEKICRIIIKELGLDPNRSRLDVSTHPFTATLGLGDVRITTNYNENNFTSSMFSTLHEGGHAIYELETQSIFGDSPCASIVSLAQHESQSRFFENIVGRSKAFCEYIFPQLQAVVLPENIKSETFTQCVNSISYTPIRVDSDELYYNLHIALRTKLEYSLISGKLQVKDLNEAWNHEFELLFNKTPQNKKEGYLQDVHWSSGLFGYFPTYTIGNLIAAQIAEKLNDDTDIFSKTFDKNSIPAIKNWLRENFYIHGNSLCTEELAKKVTGKVLSSQPLISDLKKRYCR